MQHWGAVLADLAPLGIDLYDPVVLARPWPGLRDIILSFVSSPTSRLAAALKG